MSQVRKISLSPFLLLSFLAFVLAGCGDTNPQGTNLDIATGKHPSNWLPSGHSTEAKAQMETCAQCHGANFLGGISKIACTQCHLGNQNSIHPERWGNFAYALHGNFVNLNGTTSCANANCHGTDLTGTAGGSGRTGPSCTSCHLGGSPTSAHPTDWVGDVRLHGGFALARGTSSCQNAVCHGPDLKGVFLSGPSCSTCHAFP